MIEIITSNLIKREKLCKEKDEIDWNTQLEGVSKGVGAAKMGRLLIRVGGEVEELRLATIEGRNATLRRDEDWAEGEVEVRMQPLIEAVDIGSRDHML